MKKRAFILSVLLVFAMFITGCSDKKGTVDKKNDVELKDSKKEEEKVSFDAWQGVWVNYTSYTQEEEIKAFFESLENGDEKLEKLIKQNDVGFDSMEVKGDKIVFYDKVQKYGGSVIAENQYVFVGNHADTYHGQEFSWREFKAVEKDAKYPVLLMVEPHGKNMVHIHFMAGDDAEKMLKENTSKTGTFAKEDTSIETMLGVFQRQYKEK